MGKLFTREPVTEGHPDKNAVITEVRRNGALPHLRPAVISHKRS